MKIIFYAAGLVGLLSTTSGDSAGMRTSDGERDTVKRSYGAREVVYTGADTPTAEVLGEMLLCAQDPTRSLPSGCRAQLSNSAQEQLNDKIAAYNQQMRLSQQFQSSSDAPVLKILGDGIDHPRGPQKGFRVTGDFRVGESMLFTDGTRQEIVEILDSIVYYAGPARSLAECVGVAPYRGVAVSAAPVAWNDGGWIRGYSLTEPKFFILNTGLAQQEYARGTTIRFPNGEIRTVEALMKAESFLHVVYSGEPFSNLENMSGPLCIVKSMRGHASHGPVQYTDGNWVDGLSRRESKFFVHGTEENARKYAVGKKVKFPNGEERDIVALELQGDRFYYVSFSGDPIQGDPNWNPRYGVR